MKSCLLFVGPDRGRQQAELKRLRQQLAAAYKEEPELVSFYADQDACDDILASLRNGSLFSARQLVLVYRCECFSAADAKKIQVYWKNPNSQNTVVFLSEEYGDAKDRFKFAAKDEIQAFWEVDDQEKPGWLRAYVQRHGGSIDADAVELLCELVESDTLSMQRECDTLLCVRPDRHVALADVEAYIFHSRQENVFSLFETVLALDFEAALSALQKILLSQESEPVQIVIGLQWQFRNLRELKKMASRGPAAREQLYALKIRQPRSQQLYNRALREWEAADIERRLSALAEYDLQVRQSKPEMQGLVLELMLYQMIRNPGFAAQLQGERFGIYS